MFEECGCLQIDYAVQQQLSVSLSDDYLCFIFRHFPQHQIHPCAQHAAEAAEAASAQGQF